MIPVRVDTTPRGAAVSLDGKLLGKTPLEVEIRSSARGGRLRITLRGHQPVVRRIDLSGPVELRVPLSAHRQPPEPTRQVDHGIKEGR